MVMLLSWIARAAESLWRYRLRCARQSGGELQESGEVNPTAFGPSAFGSRRSAWKRTRDHLQRAAYRTRKPAPNARQQESSVHAITRWPDHPIPFSVSLPTRRRPIVFA